MGIPANLKLDIDTTGAAKTAGTGSFDLSDLIAGRRYAKIVLTVSGGTAEFALVKGLTDARQVEVETASASNGHVFNVDDGSWPFLAVDWSSNTGTVTCDVETITGYPQN